MRARAWGLLGLGVGLVTAASGCNKGGGNADRASGETSAPAVEPAAAAAPAPKGDKCEQLFAASFDEEDEGREAFLARCRSDPPATVDCALASHRRFEELMAKGDNEATARQLILSHVCSLETEKEQALARQVIEAVLRQWPRVSDAGGAHCRLKMAGGMFPFTAVTARPTYRVGPLGPEGATLEIEASLQRKNRGAPWVCVPETTEVFAGLFDDRRPVREAGCALLQAHCAGER